MISYVDSYRDRFGVEPICRTLQFAPSTYYTAKQRPPSAQSIRDEKLKPEIKKVHKDNFSVYGARKVVVSAAPRRHYRGSLHGGTSHERPGTRGTPARQETPHHHTRRGRTRPADLVDRCFVAVAPNRLWVADITYVATWSGFAYTSFIFDVFSRRIIGWRVSKSLRADLALDALEQAIWTRQFEDATNLDGLVHHSDRGVQYLSIRYTERLAEEGAITSVGSKRDS